MRLDLKLRGDFGTLKHHAAVWPAIISDKKTMPENAVEECPDGNDFRPLLMVEEVLIEKLSLETGGGDISYLKLVRTQHSAPIPCPIDI